MSSYTVFHFCLFIQSCFYCINALNKDEVVREFTKAICQDESVTLACPRNDSIILISYALYGRMKLGSCINNFADQLCSVDIRQFVERKCAGRNSCKLDGFDRDLRRYAVGCPTGLEKFMEVNYICQTVFMPSNISCVDKTVIPVYPSQSSGYLSSWATQELNIGSSSCPWSLQMPLDKTLILTLIDFGTWTNNNEDLEATCVIYARIIEPNENVVCRGRERERVLYSRSSVEPIQIAVTNLKKTVDPYYFLIKYEVLACGEYNPGPSIRILERTLKGYKIQCSNLDVASWEITCINSQWVPMFYDNCSLMQPTSSERGLETVVPPSYGASLASATYEQQVLLIVVVIGVAIIISAFIIVLGLYCLGSWPFKRNNEAMMQSTQYSNNNPSKYDCYTGYQLDSSEVCPMVGYHSMPLEAQRDYATTLQMRNILATTQAPLMTSPDSCPVHGAKVASIGTGNVALERRFDSLRFNKRPTNITIPRPGSDGNIVDSLNMPPASPFYHELDQIMLAGGAAGQRNVRA